jgi:hypothetical protein
MTDKSPVLATRADILRVLDTSPSTMSTYNAKGLIARVGTKNFDLEETCRRVIKYLRAGASAQGGSGELKEQKTEEEIRGLRLENAIKEGELIDLDSIHHLLRKCLVAQADWCESLPDALENRGVIAPGMTGEFIRALDAHREALLNMVLSAVEEE